MAAQAVKTLWLLHGVNLDMLGRRDPALYGSMTLAELEQYVARSAEAHGFTVRSFQTNHEGELVEMLHELARGAEASVVGGVDEATAGAEAKVDGGVDEARAGAGGADAVIINPGAWTHYSYALRDALELVEAPVAEVHLSDVEGREEFRRTSVIADVVDVRVSGKGAEGYVEALVALEELVRERSDG